MSDFNEDASHVVGKEDKQQLAQTMDSLCSTPSTTSSTKFLGTGCVFRKESDNANTLRERTSTSYARSLSAQVHNEEESSKDDRYLAPIKGKGLKKPAVDSESEDYGVIGACTSAASSAVNLKGNSNMPGAAHASCIVANCRAYRGMKPDYHCKSCNGAMHIYCSKQGKDSFLYCLS